MTNKRPLRIALLAGEPSGDVLGGSLLESLKLRYPDAEFCGIGGPHMLKQGLTSWFDMETLSVMGLVEVLGRLPQLLKLRKQIVARLIEWQPDIFIGIDAPDFNLGVERRLKDAGIKTVHYVSPSVWAWRQKRIVKIDQATDLVLALLPFEKSFYDQHQVACEFVGHPLADEIPMTLDQQAARERIGLSAEDEVVAILPGSRGSEVKELARTFFDAAMLMLKQRPHLRFTVPAANEKRYSQIQSILADYPKLKVTLLHGNARDAMAAANAVLLASGTVALEAMLVKRPMVVAYRVHWLTYHIAKRLVKVNYVSLPNLLADEPLVPEILQYEMTPARLCDEINQQLEHADEVAHRFTQLHEMIRLNASLRATDAIDILIKQNLKQEVTV
ncbi:lipid-A-disaccharide synthase [Echinimonas agarilytica]|uniref:Lipid-A-disaccharide synthase n=1 Tax=Echinimonas agarilytica TaxID=1215918 RepID=A0AA41W561_9GAMM|nr:lipid-A-disaccharide synthase [Echinimonas agarilytica]MCM2679137.1 lipid-A-disaccharide synthase [Echinimonas agarilytica]